jgi:hypothetical protein
MSEPFFAPVADPHTRDGAVARIFGPDSSPEQDDLETIRRRVQASLRREEDARRAHEAKWDKAWELLKGEHNFSGKADWQAQFNVGKSISTVNGAVAILKAGITQTSDWWDLTLGEGGNEADRPLLPYLKDLFTAVLIRRDRVTRRDFIDNWILGVKAACASALLPFKIYPAYENRKVREFRLEPAAPREQPAPVDPGETLQQMAQGPGARAQFVSDLVDREEVVIRADLVDAYDVYIDTGSTKPEFILQRIRGSVADLDAMDARAGFMPDKIAEVRDLVHNTAYRTEEEDKAKERAGENSVEPEPSRGAWHGIEYWGVVYGEDGAVLLEDHVVTIIEEIVVRVKENPNQDGNPFRVSEMEPMPHSAYGRSFLEPVSGIAHAIIELANAIFDSVQYEVLKAFEVDLDVANDPGEFSDGIRPGKTFTKKSLDGKTRKLIEAVETGTMGGGGITALVQLDRMFQEGTSITDLGLSPPRMSTPATAEEVRDRQSGTSLAFRSTAQWLEKTSLEPCLSAMFTAMMSFKLFAPGGVDWARAVLGQQRAEEFFTLVTQRLIGGDGTFVTDIDFKVTALSSIVARAQELDRIARLIEAAQNIPGFLNRLDWAVVSKKIVHALGFDGEEVTLSEEEMARVKQLEEMAQAQLAASAGQQPGSNSGISAAAGASMTPAGT